MSLLGPMRSRWIRLALALIAPALGGVGAVHAEAPLASPYIFGGRPAADCEWANVARVGGCTATLMSSSILVFAAHCGEDHKYAYFEGGKRKIRIKHCEVNPEFGQDTLGEGIDWGYCELAETSWTEHIPLVPPLRQQELKQVEAPYPVTLVGYGRNNLGIGSGKLVEVDTWLTNLDEEASIGGNGADSCQGDSGGPAFVQLKDKSWRVLGITSYGGACGKGGRYALYANAIDWVEKASGHRIASCEPSSSFACEALMLDPGGDYGRDEGHCRTGPLLEAGNSRTRAPELRWASPSASKLVKNEQSLDARLEVRHAERLDNARLEVELDGKVIQIHERLHKEVSVAVPALSPGQHVLRAKIYDVDDEVRSVARAAFRWQFPEEAGTASEESESPTQSSEVKEEETASGCNAAQSPSSAWLSLLGLAWILRGSRRRMSKPSC